MSSNYEHSAEFSPGIRAMYALSQKTPPAFYILNNSAKMN